MAGSRRLAPVLRWLKYQSRGKCKIVQLLYPGFWGRLDFDIISVPEHDRNKISGENVIGKITTNKSRMAKCLFGLAASLDGRNYWRKNQRQRL